MYNGIEEFSCGAPGAREPEKARGAYMNARSNEQSAAPEIARRNPEWAQPGPPENRSEPQWQPHPSG